MEEGRTTMSEPPATESASFPSAVPVPAAPTTLAESGLGLDLVMQLTLKTLHAAGELSGAELANRLGVVFSVIEPALDLIKTHRQCEVVGGHLAGAASYRYRITAEGRAAAASFSNRDHYVGPAPVPLAQYREYMRHVAHSSWSSVTQQSVRDAYAHLVLGDNVLDEIGPAARNGRSIFIYGPPGNGKTMIARSIRDLLTGDIAVPHAIEVEGSVVRVFDPMNHEARPQPTDDAWIAANVTMDRRWMVCRRPLVIAGGELTVEALELAYDDRMGHYRAPLQLVANGGVLIIDDFGRQRSAPRDLLNRWMVPLESGVDYLTLQSGLKFEVPFLVLVVFATNLKPSELVDEAFLRRVAYKVFAANPTRQEYLQIFERCCETHGLAYDAALPGHVFDMYCRSRRITPRACHPRDIINQALRLAEYRGDARVLTRDLIEAACEDYFVQDRDESFG